ncbi:MAG: DUF222 domain-containing protein [Actinobacteria bacterium]|nr:DUF222 domain-containing protein [Actinomycetota bacterium]
MSSATAEISEQLGTAIEQFVNALRAAGAKAKQGELTPYQLTEVINTALIQQNRVAAGVTGAIGALDRIVKDEPDHRLTAGLSTPMWLAEHCRVSESAAYAQVRLARELPALHFTAQTFERGEISAQHAAVVARTVEMVRRAEGDSAHAEDLMVQEARERDPRDLLRWGLSLVHQLAPREVEDLEERRIERRFLRITEAFEGGFDIQGYLDPERGLRLKAAIDGALGPRQKDDHRSPSQRRADGLDQVVTRVLDSGELPARGGERPHLTVTASLDTLLANPGAPAAWLDWGRFPISGRALRRIACDAEITPIVIDGKGDPLHVGRKYRTATPKMRKAMAERDRRCVWPGCWNRPVECDGHHAEVPWALGGGTNVEEMALACGRHHGMLDRGWRLEKGSDGQWVPHLPEPPGPVFGPAVHDPPPT